MKFANILSSTILPVLVSSHSASLAHKCKLNALQTSFAFLLGNGQQLCCLPHSHEAEYRTKTQPQVLFHTYATQLIDLWSTLILMPKLPHLQKSKIETPLEELWDSLMKAFFTASNYRGHRATTAEKIAVCSFLKYLYKLLKQALAKCWASHWYLSIHKCILYIILYALAR